MNLKEFISKEVKKQLNESIFTTEPEIKKFGDIWEKQDLIKFKLHYRLRDDWHEPDEQEITAKVSGKTLDNAGIGDEMTVHLYYGKKEVATINLAVLLAFSTGWNGL